MRRDRGVVCGRVLGRTVDETRRSVNRGKKKKKREAHSSTYGATGKSAFLFLMGSDIAMDGPTEKKQKRMESRGCCEKEMMRKNLIRLSSFGGLEYLVGSLAPLGRGAWRDEGAGC